MNWCDVYAADSMYRVSQEENFYNKLHQRASRLEVRKANRTLLEKLYNIASLTVEKTASMIKAHPKAAISVASSIGVVVLLSTAIAEASNMNIQYATDTQETIEQSPQLDQNSSEIANVDGRASVWQSFSAYDVAGLDIDEKVELIGAMARDDEFLSGVPAELTAAQMILESGWLESELSTVYNNCFGIKGSSGGYNWDGSTWDGSTVASMTTQEEYVPGEISTITDNFRVYNSMWDSVKDHSAYLVNSGLYPGITDEELDITESIDILVAGGYATSSTYADELLNVIETYDLGRFAL